MKKFNTTAACIPSLHYMVDLSARVSQIKKMVDTGEYFTINRARQYGKTTTLHALSGVLAEIYQVVSLDFQSLGNAAFRSEGSFSKALCRALIDAKEFNAAPIDSVWIDMFEGIAAKADTDVMLDDIFRVFKRWCKASKKPVVLIIDEVDSAANNQVFLDFLAQLRTGYISRATNAAPAFQSVILAGVTDVKHLKSKIREEDQHKVNSPWNIAAEFDIDMSLSEDGIRGMLDEYEADHHTGMNTAVLAKLLREYTNGYPFLVSRICQLIDHDVCRQLGDLPNAWTKAGFLLAVKFILSEKNTLFESLTGKLINYPELKEVLRQTLMEGVRIPYNPLQDSISQMEMYGFIRNQENVIAVSNRIFEMLLYNLFLSDEELKRNVFGREGDLAKNIFVKDGRLNMPLILEHFAKTYTQIYGQLKERFLEKDGRELFLLYLKPIINGTGNYYIEAQTRDQTRTDVIVDYLGQQYIIELKIWHGERYHRKGEQQIKEYLDHFGLHTGYMLSFNFNQKKTTGMSRIPFDDKVLYEMML